MGAIPLFLFLVLTVAHDQYPLRSGCGADDHEVVKLRAGEPLQIRFALAAEEGTCYKVAAKIDGRTVEGYLPASALTGLEKFDQARRGARSTDLPNIILGRIASQAAAAAPAVEAEGGAPRAVELIQSNQPGQALAVLETALRKKSRDPNLLALAGLASYRSDDVRRALDYWKRSLEIEPNFELQELYRRAEREAAADKSAEKTVGMRFVLRYDGAEISSEAARSMIALLEEEYSRISAEIGCSAGERITAVVQSREAYRKTTDAAEWSGGQFDGRIRVALVEGEHLGGRTRRAFAHEIAHACLGSMGQWPAWLHEGIAQRISGDTLTPGARQRVLEAVRSGRMPRLSRMSQTWSRMSSEHAALAYATSLAAIELFDQHHAQLGLRNLLRNPDSLPRITADLERRLGMN